MIVQDLLESNIMNRVNLSRGNSDPALELIRTIEPSLLLKTGAKFFECAAVAVTCLSPGFWQKIPKKTGAPYTVTMTADNEFKLFADGVEIGTGASWNSSFTFTTTATQVLAVEAVDRGSYEGILLSTSNGIVSDTTWKCSKRYIKGWNQPTFNDGLWSPAVLATGPWGGIPPISSTAQWIWASPSLGTSGPAPERVYCRKKLELPGCFCCPPVPPVNNCSDAGCRDAFGAALEGECVDVTNPDLAVTSLTHNLTARPLEQNRTLCRASLQEGCCRCFLKKPCLDDGCRAAFGGAGVCLDIERGDLSTVDLTAGKREGLCKSTGVKDCCHCYRRAGACPEQCSAAGKRGRCVVRGRAGPAGTRDTGVACGPDCTCWVQGCPPTPACEDSLHGVCVADGETPPSDHVASRLECGASGGIFSSEQQHISPTALLTTDSPRCRCWVPRCSDSTCRGECVLPWEVPPPAHKDTGRYCNRRLDCHCWEPDNLPPTPAPSPPPTPSPSPTPTPAPSPTPPPPCTNKECQAAGGECLMPSQKPPAGYANKPGDWCDKETKCKCFRPRCTNSKCTKLRGSCFTPDMKIPPGATPVKVKGKPFFCNAKLKCRCMRVKVAVVA